jgi:enolase
MPAIQSIYNRRILNSHAQFTDEYVIQLQDGSAGAGASPQGETISIYEDGRVAIAPLFIINRIRDDGLIGRSLEQEQFDDYLDRHISLFGRNNVYSLSLAFLKAEEMARTAQAPNGETTTAGNLPRICCNILNGGRYAYTNPVLSDFPEYILVARSRDLAEVIADHNEIQRLVRETLRTQTKTVVAENTVSRFATTDNRECLDFLLTILERLRLSGKFDLMIDASAGDLWTDEGYRHSITDQSLCSSDQYGQYWRGIIRQYNLAFLEDPFHEQDVEAWRQLTASQRQCKIIGDNVYASDAARIAHGAARQYTHGVVIKPNQSGTITAVRRAIECARRHAQIVITSHRSISTEETFVSSLTCEYDVPYIKTGPLLTDYSSVIRLNALIRLTEQGNGNRNTD